MTEIKQIKDITSEIAESFAQLMPQLSSKCKIPDQEYLKKIISSGNCYLFAAYNPGIVGTLCLVVMQTPSGAKAWIEDVIVDKNTQRQGIGEQLIHHAIEFGKGLDISSINLTSMPERISANRLYQRVGFIKRETNVYRFEI